MNHTAENVDFGQTRASRNPVQTWQTALAQSDWTPWLIIGLAGFLRLWRIGSVAYLWSAGMGITGMILTKETYVIHIACAAIAVAVCYVSNRLHPAPDARPVKQVWDYADLAMVTATGVLAVVFFYSGTFLHWSGVKGIYQAYAAWFATGQEGHGHEKPWDYWLKLMARYEWPVLAGLLISVLCQKLKNISLRYLAIYGVGTVAAYSIVHYKTPWCIISIVWPLLFLFAAAPLVFPATYRRTVQIMSIVLLCISLSWTI